MAGRTSAVTWATVAVAAVTGGCTHAPRPARLAPPSSLTLLVEPTPPAGSSVGLTIPDKDATGHYRTVNLGIGPAATVWHMRSALNVAALSCRGPQEATLIADYNRLLADKRGLLATAFARTEADARATGGKTWRDVHDRQMTRVYNFFAQPPAKPAFCTVAMAIAAEAAAMPADSFQAFADIALPRLEAPFLDFYASYDAYRIELARWRARTTPAATFGHAPAAGLIDRFAQAERQGRRATDPASRG